MSLAYDKLEKLISNVNTVCLSKLGKAIKVTSQVTRVISLRMDGFDMIAMGIGFFNPENPFVKINQKLHSSVLYNGLQIGVNALAIFTGAATTTMTCFVAGTMILTVTGLVAIENIKAGDFVVSTNPDTMETKSNITTFVKNSIIFTFFNKKNNICDKID